MPLQKTRDAQVPRAWMNGRLLQSAGLQAGASVRIRQGEGSAELKAALDDKLPDGCVRIAAGHPATAALGPMFGSVTLEKMTAQQAA